MFRPYFRLKWSYIWRSLLLCFVLTVGLWWTVNVEGVWKAAGPYASILALFHLSEFVTIGIVRPDCVREDSFLLNHSPEYTIAAITSWIEFALEALFIPAIKERQWISWIGVIVCLLGEVIRKLAMVTAGRNFSHMVEYRKKRGHVLVTHGIYSVWRHPSYVGWFYWSIGTQMILMNPLCVIAYTLASWTFFKSRINEEERILLEFFGRDYEEYRKRVSPGIPFLSVSMDENANK